MRQTAVLSTLLLLCLIGSPGSSLAQCYGAFALSCRDQTLTDADKLSALCGDGQGGVRSSSLDLDVHITNNNGNLRCSQGGGAFSLSCSGSSVSSSGVLSADCFDVDGNLRSTQVDLNLCVENQFGSLVWACLSSYG